MNREQVIAEIVSIGVIPVIRASSAEEARSVIDAIVAGGITSIEVTMTVPGAIDLIRDLGYSNSKLLIGAGSVLNAETARQCVEAGARFIVSPATNLETIRFCNENDVAVMPGALTPTEIFNAWNAGADIVKVFPADSMGGAKYLRSIKAPLPHIKLIPTGGVNQSTAADFIRAGAEAIGVGADLVDLAAIRRGEATAINQSARNYLEIVARARENTI